MALVPQTAKRILDLGCSTGGVGWAINQRNPDAYVIGVDADEVVKDLANERLRFSQFDFNGEGWEQQPWYVEGSYDAILLLDVLEHVGWPWGLVRRAKALLKDDGVIVASVPQIRSGPIAWQLFGQGKWEYYDHAHPQRAWAGPVDNVLSVHHVRFFCRRDLEKLFLDAGMEVTQWTASLMDARGLEQWTSDLADLIGKHAGAGQRQDFIESQNVIQWIVSAKKS